MAYNITILPSSRSFPSEGSSTLLEAGLHSGLALGYGCSNGNCGECLARVVSGEVRKIRHHDYLISLEERARGQVLMCCNTAVSDVVLEAPEAQSSQEIPRQEITARVRSIEVLNDDVALLHLKTPRTQRLRFLAGQQVKLGGENLPEASHPISSCPCDEMNLHFQIPRLADNDFSDAIFEHLKKGDPVRIVGPEGSFVLNENSTRSLVFIAWHTGFAPVKSLIEHAMSLEKAASIQLVWMTRNRKDRYQDNLCRSWQDAFDNFQYLPVDIELNNERTDTASILKRLNIQPGDLSNYDVYVAGNEKLVDAYADNPGWTFTITPSAS